VIWIVDYIGYYRDKKRCIVEKRFYIEGLW